MIEQLGLCKALAVKCPYPLKYKPFAWTRWMRDKGYLAGLSGEDIHHFISDNVASHARLDDAATVPDGKIFMNGKEYLPDAKGNMVPVELIKPEALLEDETVRKICAFAADLSDQVKRFKDHTHKDLGDFEELLAQEYELSKGGTKGNKTFLSHDGLMKVQIAIADAIAFGPQLQIAKELIDECLIEWAADSRPEIRTIVTRAFNTDKEGQVNRAELFMLKRLDIRDKRWRQAMRAIDDATRIIGSKSYLRCYRREAHADAWKHITTDLSKA